MTEAKTFGTLFSGGGVADCGFVAAGMRGLWAVEYSPEIASVYRDSFPDHEMHVSPVEEIDWHKMAPVDHGHGSPVCTRASKANIGGEECSIDTNAAKGVCSFIDIIRPKTFTLENVWAYRNFHSFKMILETLTDRGYYVHYSHLNSADFGVPQTRERLILRASLTPLPLLFKTHCRDAGDNAASLFHDGLLPWVGWYDAIEDLPPTLPESEFAPWQLARMPEEFSNFLIGGGNTNATVIDSVARCQGDPAFTVAINGLRNNRAFLIGDRLSTGGTKLQINKSCEPANTITCTNAQHPLRALIAHGTDMRTMPSRRADEPMFTVMACAGRSGNRPRAFIADGQRNGNGNTMTTRDSEDRVFTITASSPKRPQRAWLECGRVVKMTPRALARFQSIPDSYRLPENNRLAGTVIGNGWPSLMAQRVAESFRQ